MDILIEMLAEEPLLLLFLVAAVGWPLGRIPILGSRLGVAAVLFAGLAVGALDPRLRLPDIIYLLGLVLFIYPVGLSSGPTFFASFRRKGLRDNLLVAGVLAWIAWRAASTGWRLAATLSFLYFGIMHFNSLIEALFFGFLTPYQFGALIFLTVVMAVLLAAGLTVVLALPASTIERNWTPRFTIGRLALGAFAYLIIYFVAGLSIYPFISHYYDQQAVPPGLQVISMQLFARGPIFVGLAAIVILITRASRVETMLMVATTLSVIGGIAPLMVPNTFMPDSIRWPHLVEVTTSNFIFGLILGWLLTAAVRTPAATTASDRPDRAAQPSAAPAS